jgi:hypothetical protein
MASASRHGGQIAAVAVMLLAVACGGSGDPPETERAGGGGVSHVDDVVPVAEYGFTPYQSGGEGRTEERVTYGWVVQNISDQVAVGVRVHVTFYDEAGDEIEELRDDEEFGVVLPGRPIGGGDDRASTGGRIATDMGVAVTYVAALDTMEGGRYRGLEHGDPVTVPERSSPQRRTWTLAITNTYDIPLTPVVHHVLRSPDGAIVGGVAERPVGQPVQPGAAVPAEVAYDLAFPDLAETVPELYVDAAVPWPTVADPVWEQAGA